MVNGKIQTISILGPTASGKTSLALEVASRIGGEIVSCDSMLLYRDMNIGTAKPTCEEMRAIPHHMINIISAEEDFSVADYTEMASEIISEIKSRNKVPIICGGTFLYHDSLLYLIIAHAKIKLLLLGICCVSCGLSFNTIGPPALPPTNWNFISPGGIITKQTPSS